MSNLSLSLHKSKHHAQMIVWFMVISFGVIATISTALGTLMSRHVTRQMLDRDLVVSMEFLNALVRDEGVSSYFYGDKQNPNAAAMEEFLYHVAHLPTVVGANVFGADRTVLWSSDPTRIGHVYSDNEELEAAMRGELNFKLEDIDDRHDKSEFIEFPEGIDLFVEAYIPIWSEDRTYAIGAIEIYKAPNHLIDAIHRGRMLVWAGAVLSGLVLYGGLLIVVIYATRILQRQEARLIETERLAVVGEMASAVAHGLRNPLAAIRSCAELALEDDLPATSREPISDIISQSDRLETWIRAFLIRAREQPDAASRLLPLDPIIRVCLSNFNAQMKARDITCSFSEDDNCPLIMMPAPELEQVLNSALANSIEAMGSGGSIEIRRTMRSDGRAHLTITDTGPGIPDEMKAGLFKPFVSGKPSGMGVGLALARRIMERFGGTLNLDNVPPDGVEVRLTIPAQGTAA